MQMRLTLSASVVLYKIIVKLLFVDDKQERDLPFNIRYKLQRCLEMLEKDAVYYEQERVKLVEKYGEKQEDGTIKVADDKNDQFNEDARKLLSTETEHALMKLTPEEVLQLDVKGISHDEMTLFIAAMIDDPELTEDLNTPITEEKINDGEAVTKEETANK